MSTIKTAVLEELKPHKLTKVTGRKPTFDDVERWVEECSDIAAKVKTDCFAMGQDLGHIAMVIPQEEYRLELDNEDWEYEEPSDPGPYSEEITADTVEFEKSRLEAKHKRAQDDYQRYEAVKEHLQNEFQECMDEAWIIKLRKPRSKYTTRTVKEFLDHLKNNAKNYVNASASSGIKHGTSPSTSLHSKRCKSRLRGGCQIRIWTWR